MARALLATFASWTARWSIANCLVHAFSNGGSVFDTLLFRKQVIVGILML
ncbi:MAG: hypothetical protein IPG69_21480 [Flavobacteriales bacterium]|nr:hypothetical protein [Flavobacteriales bacterium]